MLGTLVFGHRLVLRLMAKVNNSYDSVATSIKKN